MPNKKYRLYPKAIEDLEGIFLYGCCEFGIKKAENYIKNLETGFQDLANSPEIARKCDYIRNKLRAWNIASHVVFFKITKYGIAIIRVLHKSMDYIRHIQPT